MLLRGAGLDLLGYACRSINRLRLCLPRYVILLLATSSIIALALAPPPAPAGLENLALLNASSLTDASAGGDEVSFSAALDSGCTASATSDSRRITNKRPCNELFGDANGRIVRCTEIGDMPVISTAHDGQSINFAFANVRVVPSFKYTLLSVSQL